MEIILRPHRHELLRYIAEQFLDVAAACIAQKGGFSVILGGGQTPGELNRHIVELSVSSAVDWTRVTVFYSDERCVPPDHEHSNHGMIRRTLLEPLSIPPTNVYRIEGEHPPRRAADHYHRQLQQWAAGENPVPAIDLALLGFGPDGHTASLFPGDPLLAETDEKKRNPRLAVAVGKGPDGLERITLTPTMLNAAHRVWFMITGAPKAEAVAQLINGTSAPPQCPARAIRPHAGPARCYLDHAAAARIVKNDI